MNVLDLAVAAPARPVSSCLRPNHVSSPQHCMISHNQTTSICRTLSRLTTPSVSYDPLDPRQCCVPCRCAFADVQTTMSSYKSKPQPLYRWSGNGMASRGSKTVPVYKHQVECVKSTCFQRTELTVQALAAARSPRLLRCNSLGAR